MSRTATFGAGETREFYEVGDFFRLLETTAAVNVEFYYQGREIAEMIDIQAGYAESFARDSLRFDRIRIVSPSAQTVKWVVREGSDVRYDRGAASITGTVEIGVASIASLNQIELPTGFYGSSTNLAASGNETVFTPAANVNGAIIWSAEFATRGGVMARYGAKSSALTGFTDGQTLCTANRFDYSTADNAAGQMARPIRIASGLGVYFYSNHAETAAARSMRYTLL